MDDYKSIIDAIWGNANGGLKALIAAGVDVNAQNGDKETPLHEICRQGSLDVIIALTAPDVPRDHFPSDHEYY